MIPVSQEFKDALANDKRDWIEEATITLADNTVLEITNADIWGGGFEVEDAVSGDNSFGALGATVINKATLVLNNIYDKFSAYDFTGARVEMRVGLQLTEKEMLKKGKFVVDEAKYNGSLITLECLDDMVKFDRPYSESTLRYPANLYQIVDIACRDCGMIFATDAFPRESIRIMESPIDDALTFREVIRWVAEISGTFARVNNEGELELKWFDIDALKQQTSSLDGGVFDSGTPKYTSGDTADGGRFNPWDVGYVADSNSFDDQATVHTIYSIYSEDIAIDQTIITGVRISVKTDEESTGKSVNTYLYGTEGYVVDIVDNDFITESNVSQILNGLGAQLVGTSFRKADVTHSSDPSIEAGDVAVIYPRKGNHYALLVSRTTFSAGSAQKTVSASETPVRNSAVRFTEPQRVYAEVRERIQKERVSVEQVVTELSTKLDEKSGLYSTTETGTSGTIYYLHDQEKLADSEIVWKMNSEAIGVSTDGGHTWNFGVTVDGATITRILQAEKVSASLIQGGTLILGGNNNTNGVLEVRNNANSRIGRWDKDALYIGNIGSALSAPNTKIDTAGAITTKSLTANNYVYVYGNTSSRLFIPATGTASAASTNYIDIQKTGLSCRFGNIMSAIKPNNTTAPLVMGSPNDVNNNVSTPTAAFARYGTQGMDFRNPSGGKSAQFNFGGMAFFKKANLSDTGTSVSSESIYTTGSLTVRGTKNRLVSTEHYGDRLMYSYETPSPLFGDVGEGEIAEDGKCYVQIDNVFAETVTLSQYQVFLQKYGDGDCWVAERCDGYFVVEGTAGLKFGWELKARQKDFDQRRIDTPQSGQQTEPEIDYGLELQKHISFIREEREVAIA